MAHVIYDQNGQIWNIIYGADASPQDLKCMEVDIPDGAAIVDIDTTDKHNPKPRMAWAASTADQKESIREKMVETVRDKVERGEDMKAVIKGLSLSNEDKWKLEKEVREAMTNGV